MDFNQTLIGNAEMTVGGVNVGIIRGPLKVQRNVERQQMRVGTPQRLLGEVLTQENFTVEAPLAEFSPENMKLVLANVPIVNVPGDPVVVANQNRTFKQWGNTGVRYIQLSGGTVTDLTIHPTVGEAPPPYEEGVDYLVDDTSGLVFLLPDSEIGGTDTVRCSYTYVPVASQKLRLGVMNAFADAHLIITHTSPITNKRLVINMWRAQGDGNLDFNFTDGEFQVANFKAVALDDSANNPDEPLGTIEWLPAL